MTDLAAIHTALAPLREAVRRAYLGNEGAVLEALMATAGLAPAERAAVSGEAADLVRAVRSAADPTLMEAFLAEYGLSTREGIALMCLAEALLRIPDPDTIDALIHDKITPADWGQHLGRSHSSLVNASTWALMLTGRTLGDTEADGLAATLHRMIRRLGEPVVRTAVNQSMRELGRQFVLGTTIDEAIERADDEQARGYSYSYDMLGEAARTDGDAKRYLLAYSRAISAIAPHAGDDLRASPGISVKLSALHCRYEYPQRERVVDELANRAHSLALLAASANIGFNIDAEEADRLDLSLDVIERIAADPALAGWDGFGVVVQAYGPRAPAVLDWLHALATRLDRRFMVRLVKGAYWDTEIKRAQVLGLTAYPVFTHKAATDVAYIACARRLLGMRDRIYPQFATHNAHTAAAVLHMARAGASADEGQGFEFQRLHGMGEALHEVVRERHGTRCRIYAPVGAHRDLLAYLVRRLLENGANSSFVHQIVDAEISPETIARDPFETVQDLIQEARARSDGPVQSLHPAIPLPEKIFGPLRENSRGWDLTDPVTVAALEAGRSPFAAATWSAAPTTAPAGAANGGRSAGPERTVLNPARGTDRVGTVRDATAEDVEAALRAGAAAFPAWNERGAAARAACLRRLADLYEASTPELVALAAREAGKTALDGIGEVREAVDFLRYYAGQADPAASGRGLFVCISPWNFPLAIFTGQIAAALVAGNSVIAKPAEQTSLMAARAVALMHAAGIPPEVVQLLPGDGATVGGALVSDPRVAGVCFTGSTETAKRIDAGMAAALAPDAPLIAETGGLNAMVVDSTALPEQAVRDILASAFQSAGQRCSALRILYVQEEVMERTLEMLFGAMRALRIGDPWQLSTDVGPVIDAEARDAIAAYCERHERTGAVLARLELPPEAAGGHFIAPVAIRVTGIEDLESEVFGPVLHVASYRASALDAVVEAINAKGYGLTLGIHTRVDERVQDVVAAARVGNVYVNRNQIGAVVGSQPFGGEGLSGTGPKAGGPLYLRRFVRAAQGPGETTPGSSGDGAAAAGDTGAVLPDPAALRALAQTLAGRRPAPGSSEHPGTALRALIERLPPAAAARAEGLLARAAAYRGGPVDLPGPTGESNRYAFHPRGTVLCLGRLDARDPAPEALVQAVGALALGNAVVVAAPGVGSLLPGGAGALPVGTGALPLVTLDAAGGGALVERVLDAMSVAAVMASGPAGPLGAVRRALAAASGPIVPLVADEEDLDRLVVERALCIDTTAAGGNTTLLAQAAR